MIDFLKTNPYVTREEYLWQWTIPQVRLASCDFTHVKYYSDEEAEKRKTRKQAINTIEDLMRVGIPKFD